MISISNSNNSIALTLLRSNPTSNSNSTLDNGNNASQQGSNIISGLINSGPQQKAADAIAKIVMDNGGQFITGGNNSTLEGGDRDDYIKGALMSDVSVKGGAGDDTIITDGGQGTFIEGGDGNDNISTLNNVKISGGAGNDYISANAYNTVDGGAGDDRINVGGNLSRPQSGNVVDGGTGNDTIMGQSYNVLNGGEGNDSISANQDFNVVSGGQGNDAIVIRGDSNTINGGIGNDTIGLDSDNNIVNFSIGDGKDNIALRSGTGNTIKLGEGLNQSDMKISYEGTTATISFEGRDEELTVEFFTEDSLSIEFSDGESISIKSESEITALSKGYSFLKYGEDGGMLA